MRRVHGMAGWAPPHPPHVIFKNGRRAIATLFLDEALDERAAPRKPIGKLSTQLLGVGLQTLLRPRRRQAR